ncbi:uncharacterized protein LOC112493984 [Cephus cinctus]|uniref:Uncharacterized protein LOC112493984 n=1 Tax=Cephus cinctus TaxID=211228 RepID=A0AAJ7VYW1_CEPCN|nr:uncharacterized protein LOC112493984 [Cephus cinctus]
MQREKLEEQKNILRQIAKASDSIRRKHRMIKLGKENVEHAMSEVFKPVVTPLQKLVNVSQTEHNTIKDKIKDEIKDEIKHNVGINDTFETTNESFNTLKNDSTIGEISDIQDDDNDNDDDDGDGDDGYKNDMDLSVNPNDSMQRYLNMLLSRQNKQLDTTYGVRKLSKKKLMVGDSPISFEGDQVHIGDTSYPKTNGLIELLFRKIPNETHVTQDDLNNYKNIIITTNAYKKYYKPDGDIRRSKSFKFKNVIAKLIEQSSVTGIGIIPRSKSFKFKNVIAKLIELSFVTGKGIIPRYMIAAKDRLTDYVYWDDPNELVDRLRLLLASQEADTSVDVFGRQLSSKAAVTSSRGLPGVGFKFTAAGHYDIDNKRLCNVANPEELNDAVTLNLMKTVLKQEIDTVLRKTAEMRNEIDNNNLMIRALDSTVKDALNRLEADIKTAQDLTIRNSEIISQLDARLNALENGWKKVSDGGRTA